MDEKIRDMVLDVLENEPQGATITDIESKVSYERHTLSKYLGLMEREGFIYHRPVGKAKLYFLNKSILKTLSNTLKVNRTFTENVLLKLLDQIPMAVITTNENLEVEFMNKIAKDMYGEVEGNFYDEIIGLGRRPESKKIKGLINNEITHVDTFTEDKTGRLVEIRASKFINPTGAQSIIMILDDITDFKNTEKELREYIAQMQIRDDLTRHIVRRENIDRDKLLKLVGDRVSSLQGDAFLVQLKDGNTWETLVLSCIDDTCISKVTKMISLANEYSEIREKVIEEKMTRIASVKDLEVIREEFGEENDLKLNSIIFSPLIIRNNIVGVMSLWRVHNEEEYSKNDREFMDNLANRVSLTIEFSNQKATP